MPEPRRSRPQLDLCDYEEAHIQERIHFANALRGIAALVVLISHYVGSFWLARPVVAILTAGTELDRRDYPDPDFAAWFMNCVAPVQWSAFGVALFFLISGFVIPFSFAGSGAGAFLLGRTFRIVPTYVAGFAIVIGAIASNVGLMGTSFPYSAQHVAIHAVPGLRDLAWVTSIDGIVWTLEIEIKFYILSALIAPWLRSASLLTFVVPATALSLVLLAPQGYTQALLRALWLAAPFLVFMFIGTALNFFHRGLISWRLAGALTLALLLAFRWLAAIVPTGAGMFPSYVAALACFAIAMRWAFLLPDTRPVRFLADISYPLYVAHGIPGYVLLTHLTIAGVAPWLAIGIATGAALALALGLHLCVERPTHSLGRRLAARTSSSGSIFSDQTTSRPHLLPRRL